MPENQAFDFSQVETQRPEPQQFHIQAGGKHFQVEAFSRDEAIEKANRYIQANPDKFRAPQQETEPSETVAPAEPAEQKGPFLPKDEKPLNPDDPLDPRNLPEVTTGGTGIRPDGSLITPNNNGLNETGNPVMDSLTRFGREALNQYLRTERYAARVLGAAPEMALTLGSGAVGEVAGGIAGLFTAVGAAFSDDITMDDAAENVRAVSDALTFEPVTDNAEKVLQDVAGPLLAYEQGVDRLAYWGAQENPELATIFKTILIGGPEILGLRGANKTRVFNKELTQRARALQDIGEQLGIDFTQKNMAESVVNAANDILPSQRGQHAPELRQRLEEHYRRDKDNLDESFETARQGEANLYIANLEQAVPTMAANVRRKYDVDVSDSPGMQSVKNALDDLENIREMNPMNRQRRSDRSASGNEILPNQRHLINIDELETIRRRLSAVRGQGGPAGGAAAQLINDIDVFYNKQFNRDLINGDKMAIENWKAAREANHDFFKRWKDDKIIKDLLEQDVTPEKMNQWLLGSSALGANRNAGSVLKRIKGILGDNHPVIKGIRQDFLFEIAMPLLEGGPTPAALKTFIRNYDRTILRNPSIVKELGINRTEIKALRDFAETASRLPANTVLASAGDVTTLLARFIAGHEIAKATIRVNLTRNLMNILIRKDRVSRKQILADALNVAQPDVPIALHGGGTKRQFALAMGLTSLSDTVEAMEEEGYPKSGYTDYLKKLKDLSGIE